MAIIDPDLKLDFSIRKLNGTIEGNLLQPLNYKGELYYEFGNSHYNDEGVVFYNIWQTRCQRDIWSTNNGYLRIGLWENSLA